MSLSKKIKVGLDETRILILGSQILLGFGFQIAFRPGFQSPPPRDRIAEAAALALITLTVGLIIAPSAHHRIVESGEDTKRLLSEIRRYAAWALAPFAAALGLDVFLVSERVLGSAAGAAAGLAFFGAAAIFWYGAEFLKARQGGGELRGNEDPERESTPLGRKIEQMLTETRVVLPGAQALLGFQLIIVFSDAFERLTDAGKYAHLASFFCVALAVIWLMAPASFHRIVYAGEDTPEFHRIGTRFLLASSVALAFGIAGDLGVVMAKVLSSSAAGIGAAALALALLVGLWHVYPAVLRLRRKA